MSASRQRVDGISHILEGKRCASVDTPKSESCGCAVSSLRPQSMAEEIFGFKGNSRRFVRPWPTPVRVLDALGAVRPGPSEPSSVDGWWHRPCPSRPGHGVIRALDAIHSASQFRTGRLLDASERAHSAPLACHISVRAGLARDAAVVLCRANRGEQRGHPRRSSVPVPSRRAPGPES